jgi:hypothetical protein
MPSRRRPFRYVTDTLKLPGAGSFGLSIQQLSPQR